mmetsp:Transcript_53351/g.117140  ORF Transcript_53351/g.117140 Transcript_53351/m.117140 type:complete len:228 (+) Transcript_53351:607-1290(+)
MPVAWTPFPLMAYAFPLCTSMTEVSRSNSPDNAWHPDASLASVGSFLRSTRFLPASLCCISTGTCCGAGVARFCGAGTTSVCGTAAWAPSTGVSPVGCGAPGAAPSPAAGATVVFVASAASIVAVLTALVALARSFLECTSSWLSGNFSKKASTAAVTSSTTGCVLPATSLEHLAAAVASPMVRDTSMSWTAAGSQDGGDLQTPSFFQVLASIACGVPWVGALLHVI